MADNPLATEVTALLQDLPDAPKADVMGVDISDSVVSVGGGRARPTRPGLAEEFGTGLQQGGEQLQAGIFGAVMTLGQIFGSDELTDFGREGVERNMFQATFGAPGVGGLGDVDNAGDFFRWMAKGLGQSIPSLVASIGGGGLGALVGRRVLTGALRRHLTRQAILGLEGTSQLRPAVVQTAVRNALALPATHKLLYNAARAGAAGGALAVSSTLEGGHIAAELDAAGITAPGTVAAAGLAAGALDALPVLRLMDKVFPGVDKQLARSFVRDMATTMGTQGLIEGSTEAAQEAVAMAALAYHDPSFNPFDHAARMRALEAGALGTLVGVVTGGLGSTAAQLRGKVAEAKVYSTESSERVREHVREMTRPIRERNIEGMTDAELREAQRFPLTPSVQQVLDEVVAGGRNTLVNSEVDQAASDIVTSALTEQLNALRETVAGGLNAVQDALRVGEPEADAIFAQLEKAEQVYLERAEVDTQRLVRRVRQRLLDINRQAQNLSPEAAQELFERELAQIEAQAIQYTATRHQFILESVQQDLANRINSLPEQLDIFADETTEGSQFDDAIDLFETREVEPKISFGQQINKRFNVGRDRMSRPQRVRSTGDDLVPFESREAAEQAAEEVRGEYPGVSPTAIGVGETAAGFTVEVNDFGAAEEIFAQKRFNDALIKARAFGQAKDPRTNRRVLNLVRPDGTRTRVDIPTLALGGMDMVEREGVLGVGPNQKRRALAGLDAAIGRLLEQGITIEGGMDAVNQASLLPQGPTVEEARRQIQFGLVEPGRVRATEEGDRGLGDRPEPFLGEADFADPLSRKDSPLETERQQAEVSARSRGGRAQTGNRATTNVFTEMPGTNDVVARRLRSFVFRMARVAGLSDQRITIIDATELEAVNRLGSSKYTKAIRDNMKLWDLRAVAQVVYDVPNKQHVIIMNPIALRFKKGAPVGNAKMAARAVMHEVGHIVQVVHFDRMELDAKLDMADAWFDSGSSLDFAEWMADQFVAWSVRDDKGAAAFRKFWMPTATRQLDAEPVQTFVSRTLTALRQMFDAVKRAFSLSEEYAEFLRGVRGVVHRGVAEGRYGKQVFRSRFRDLGAAGARSDKIIPPNSARGKIDSLNIPDPDVARGKLAQMKQRLNARYPSQMEGAGLMWRTMQRLNDQWVSSTNGVLRRMKLPAAQKLADMFHHQRGEPLEREVYFDAVQRMRGVFFSQVSEIFEGASDQERAAAVQELMQLNGRPGQHQNSLARRLRALMDQAEQYAIDSGLPLVRVQNYWPRIWDATKVRQNEGVIRARMQQLGWTQAAIDQALANMLAYDDATDVSFQQNMAPQAAVNGAPTADWLKARKSALQDPFFDQFLVEDPNSVLETYLNSLVKRAEFNTRLGQDAQAVGDPAKYDPIAKYRAIIDEARDQGATQEQINMMQRVVEAQLGRYGANTPDQVRRVQAWIMTYQNVRLLGFSQLASLPDIIGPAIRSNDFRRSWQILRQQLGHIASSESNLAEFARITGIISDTLNQHILTEHYDTKWMPARARQINEAFFHYTGMEKLNNFVRQYSLAVGMDFIKQRAAEAARGNLDAESKLQELGLTPAQVREWEANGERAFGANGYDLNNRPGTEADQAVSAALVRFVNEANMRPNPSQRPLMSSHPALMLVYHLKSFLYAFYEVFLQGMAQNAKEAGTPWQAAVAIALPAALLMFVTGVALEIRELIQYRMFGNEGRTDRMDGMEYVWELAQRSGLFGPSQLIVDWESADERGNAGLVALAGPSLEQLNELINEPASESVPKSVPVASQLPELRDWLREATPL